MAAVGHVACRDKGPGPDETVVVVGLDGLDRIYMEKLIDQGLLPNFAKVLREGAIVDLEIETELLSPIIWTSLASGYPPSVHGIDGWVSSSGLPHNATNVRADRVWDSLSDEGQAVLVTGWLMTTPVNEVSGRMISDEIVFRAGMDTDPSQQRSPCWTDEAPCPWEVGTDPGSRVRNDDTIASWLVHPGKDLPTVQSWIPDTTWLEAQATMGYQVSAFGPLFHPLKRDELNIRVFENTTATEAPRFSAIYLGGIDQVAHLFWTFTDENSIARMKADRKLWNQAAAIDRATMPGKRLLPFGTIPTSDVVLDAGAQWMRDAYRYADEVVGRVLAKVDPTRTTVVICSDHGFKVNEVSRENPVPLFPDHRSPAVLMAWGNRVQTTAQVESVSMYDVAPTLYALLNQAPSQDMPGRVRTDLFRIDDPERTASRARATSRVNGTLGSSSRVELLESLGYIDNTGAAVPRRP